MEVPIKSLDQSKWKECRACGKPFDVTEAAASNSLKMLSEAVAKLKTAAKLQIQFVLPCKQVCRLNEVN
jgi:hypothetical protein